MSRYLFVQNQDPFTEARTGAQFDLARRLAESGRSVTLLLVQNGVTAARQGAQCPQFDALAAAGVNVCADSFSLLQREISPGHLKPAVKTAEVGMVVDALLDGDKVIWN
ncbi:MAG: DsrE family protein [Methylophilaceae bacterium]